MKTDDSTVKCISHQPLRFFL